MSMSRAVVGAKFLQRLILALLLCSLNGLASRTADAQALPQFRFEHEGVLGTSLDLRIQSVNRDQALRAEAAALAEIERLRMLLSTYDPQSEVSVWLASNAQSASPQAHELSAELATVLRRAEHWQIRSNGAFHPAVERASQLWRSAEREGRVPTASELQLAAIRANNASPDNLAWSWEQGSTRNLALQPALNFDALAKGFIIDQVAQHLLKLEGISGVCVNIGGDLRVAGTMHLPVQINEPVASSMDSIQWTMQLESRAMATSGIAYRGFEIAGERFSHLIDPRTATPVAHTLSVSVLAPEAMDADALATTMSVLSVDESMELAASLSEVECLIVTADGKAHASAGWPGRVAPATTIPLTLASQPAAQDEEQAKVDWNGGYELEIEFEIVQAQGGRYRKPYVAVWIEDKDGFPVKTLALWYQNNGGGNRWLPDLKRWHRNDRVRALVEPIDLLATVASPSRRPGQYKLLWNGTDNTGQVVKPGEYTIYIEVAREHGTYQLMRSRMTLDDEPASEELEGNEEIGGATIRYRRKE